MTGGSDGIGLEMCNRLAGLGFNICMVSRDGPKMALQCSKIERSHPVKTKSIVCDFSKVCSIAEYTKIVANEITNLDVSMVFLNAGGSIPGTTYDLTDVETQTIIRLNFIQPIYITKALLP